MQKSVKVAQVERLHCILLFNMLSRQKYMTGRVIFITKNLGVTITLIIILAIGSWIALINLFLKN